MGVDRSTYYRWKGKVDRWGLEALAVRERRRPRMPTQIGPHLEQKIIAFALGHPGLGARRISAELARQKWGAIRISEHGVWRVLVRVGLNTRSKRLALIARHRDPYERTPDLPPPSATSTPRRRARRSSSTASSSAGFRAPRARSGNTPPSTSRRPSAGPSCTPPNATRALATPASSSIASHARSPPPAGSCARSPPTTGRNSAPARSATPSSTCAPVNASSAPAAPTQTAASNAPN